MKLVHKFTALLILVITSVTFADWTTTEDNWYSVTIDGMKSGWAHEIVEVDSETKNIKSTKVQNMTLSRGGMEITIVVSSSFTETAEGKPISVESFQEAMGMVQETKWKFIGDSIETTTAAGGAPIVKTIANPTAPWLTPQAVKRMFTKKMNANLNDITYQTMTPELGPGVITVVMTKKSESKQDVLGEEKVVISWETVNDKLPVVGTEFYTTEGQSIGSKMNAGFGAIENKIMTKQEISLLNINLSNARSENESYVDYRARLKRNKDILKAYFTHGREGFREMFPNGVADAITDAQAQMVKDEVEVDE